MIVWANTTAAKQVIHPSLSKIPAFPATAGRLLSMLSGEADLLEIAALVQTDATFGAEILRLANSAAFSTHRQVKALTPAIALIGFDRLRSLTLTVAVRSVMQHALVNPIARQCWGHSLASARIAERFGGLLSVNKNEGYALGLLHDIGRIGLLAADTMKYCNLLEHRYANPLELCKAERGLLGLDHSETGEILAGYWGLPAVIGDVAGCHHETPKKSSSAEAILTHVCCRLADFLGFGVSGLETSSAAEIVAPCEHNAARAILDELPDMKDALVRELGELELCQATAEAEM